MTNPAAALLRVSLVVSAGLLVPAVLLAETAPPADYIRAVHERVAKVTVYPKMAKLRGQEGKVGCVVKISPTGDLLDGVARATMPTCGRSRDIAGRP